MIADLGEPSFASQITARTQTQQAIQSEHKLGGSKLDSCFLEVLLTFTSWQA